MKRSLTFVFALVSCALMTGQASATPYNDAVSADSPLFYWTFDEASGDALEQVAGNAADSLAPQNGAARASSTSTTGGVSLGTAGSFDGVDDSFLVTGLTTGGNDFITSQRWALEFWFRPDDGAASSYVTYSTRNNTLDNPAMTYNVNQDAGVPLLEYTASGNGSGVALADDQWYHVVVAFYGNSGGFADNLREVYVNGSLALSDTTSSFSSGFGLDGFEVGARSGLSPFAGLVDEIAIYELGAAGDLTGDKAFVADVADHYNLAVPEPMSGVLFGIGLIGLALSRRRRRRSL